MGRNSEKTVRPEVVQGVTFVLCVAGARWYGDKYGDKYGDNAVLRLWDPGLQGAGGGH